MLQYSMQYKLSTLRWGMCSMFCNTQGGVWGLRNLL